jgi:dienelactone hydrolase
MRSLIWLTAWLFFALSIDCASGGELSCRWNDCFAIKDDEIIVPKAPGQNNKYPIVVLVPGCAGLDGSGMHESGLGKTAKKQFEREGNLIKKQFIDLEGLLKGGHFLPNGQKFGVLKVDYNKRYGVSCSSLLKHDVRREIPNKIAELVIHLLKHAKESRQGKALDFKQIHLIGWSLGGIGVLHTRLQDWTKLKISRPNTITAYYPSCLYGDRKPWQHDKAFPTLIFIPEDDNIPDLDSGKKLPDSCKSKLGDPSKRARDIDVVLISGARHSFDVPNAKCVEALETRFCTGEEHAAARQEAQIRMGKHIADHK